MFTFTWLGQGGFLLRCGDNTIVIDPYLSDSVSTLDGFHRLLPLPLQPEALAGDLLITTHDHLDHLDPDTLKKTDPIRNRYAGPEDCLRHMRELGLPEARLTRLAIGDTIRLNDCTVTGVPAVHTSPEAIGVTVEYGGRKLYFSGDTLYDEALFPIADMGIDMMFICINGRLGNMSYCEAAKLARRIGCKVCVPDHYAMFAENTVDPELFVASMEGSGIRVVLPEFNKETDIEALFA